MRYRSKLRFRRFLRRYLHQDDPPERLARGLAAGVVAALLPVAELRFFVSLLFAWIVRGNKAVAILPQFITYWFSLTLIGFQVWLGAKIWPGSIHDHQLTLSAARAISESWDWSNPDRSLHQFAHIVRTLPHDVSGPLLAGVVISACAGAAAAYPLCLVCVSYFRTLRLRWRAQRGIGFRPPRGHLTLPAPSSDEASWTEDDLLVRYALRPKTYVRADAVRMLIDGAETYPEMLHQIGTARKTVDLQTYILRADATGRRFAAALIAAAGRGVRVRLLYDGVGSFGIPQSYVDDLLNSGVEVCVFRPIQYLWSRGFSYMNRRAHRKIMIVDRQVAFVGGLNIADDYAPITERGGGWRDTHLRLDGAPHAQQFEQLFDEVWTLAEICRPSRASASPPPAPPQPTPTSSEAAATPSTRNALVQVLSNKEFFQRVRVRRSYLRAIRNARRYILLENAYFIPDRGIRRALTKAVKRGVQVAVVVAMYSDVEVAALASRSLYGELLASGVRLFEYPLAMMHSKIAVIDDSWSMISSYNLDHRSLLHSLEAGALVLNREFSQKLREQVLLDIERSREITLQFHNARPWHEALLESLSYQMRYWL